ncbi:MAG: hypothetical protein FD137_401 [Spirochaetes bacterium]|nr:MAG: hypothetical protein FD137_401 [Spirochaetota bacterium]
MSIEHIRKCNPSIDVRSQDDPLLGEYARLIDPRPFAGLVALADRTTAIDPAVNRYVGSCPELEADPSFSLLGEYFGFADIQVGYCNGPNSKLNAVEWHKSSEIDIAVTDMILLLGKRSDIDSKGNLHSSRLECFYIAKGGSLEILPEVLHFSPCKVHPEGFKSIIVLPRGTNEALDSPKTSNAGPESQFLFMKNKWLIAHPERLPLVQKGAYPGIMGENIEIFLEA